MTLPAFTAPVYTDLQGLNQLRHQAREDASGALHEVARQFESLFIQMMMKNMRAASFGEELFSNDQTEHYEAMFDQQMSLHLGQRGGLGLADLLVRQLGGGIDDQSKALEGDLPEPITSRQGQATGQDARSAVIGSPREFVELLMPDARAAAERLGVDPEVLLAQAALETGWGSRMITGADGTPSYNLFGIKADQRWTGDSVMTGTLEFEDGIAVRRQAAFRAYDSFQESFADYVEFIQSSPRYQPALAHEGDARHYVNGLQQGGYATDPEYADKISRIMNSEWLTENHHG